MHVSYTDIISYCHKRVAEPDSSGPEYKPRRHQASWQWALEHGDRAQRRPEYKPRRHICFCCIRAVTLVCAQRRPEYKPRRHGCAAPALLPAAATLNEGRSINPGDTGRRQTQGQSERSSAQRRPEYKPRRHHPDPVAVTIDVEPAQRRPEYKPRRHLSGRSALQAGCPAQRRPEYKPRRHATIRAKGSSNPLRSTKAGV